MVNPHHDASIDAAVIREFTRWFPRLTFLTFFRNRRSPALHVIDFAGQLADLTAAGVPSAGENLAWCDITQDRRRKAGTLVASLRIEDGTLPTGHPMAWLEPQKWMRVSADASAQTRATDVGAAATVLRHERFEGVPAHPQKRRRGPLPRGVVSIKSSPRLRVGALVEILSRDKRARILDFDWREDSSVEVQSLDGPIPCNDGSTSMTAWIKPSNLRRVWTGLSTNERIQLRIRRAS